MPVGNSAMLDEQDQPSAMSRSNGVEPADSGSARHSPASFFRSRWRGHVPLGRLFWQDMLIYGTAINALAALVALLLFAWDAPTALGVVVYFAPLPYNLFLFAAVWKAAAMAKEPWSSAARISALLWLIVATMV